MSVPAVMTITAYLSMTGGAAAKRLLETSPAMHDIFKSVVPPEMFLAPAGQRVRALAADDACAITSPLSIEDNSFDSTGCYVGATFNGDLLGFVFTETGVEPSSNGTGWDQRITFGVWASQSGLSSTSTSQWASSYTSTDDYTGQCQKSWKADGECDWMNNNAECDYDGGDCCECTCVDSDSYTCGDGHFDCTDPSAPCVNDLDHSSGNYTGECEVPSWQADGMCDWGNNNAACDFDGGDCCECTCVDGDYGCGDGFFDCVDPSAPCVNDDDHDYSTGQDDYTGPCAVPYWKADGICDWGNNNEGCEYDGGDCCECTCVDGEDYECSDGSFDCVDPSAPCVNDDDNDYTGPCEVPSWKADGICDWGNNNEGCDYDGGDCCECTCVDSEYNCVDSFFDCVDPSAPCVDEDDDNVDNANECEWPSWKADGICDWGNNNEGCDFDGGDCCECTCVDGENYDCTDGFFQCVDPSAPCVNDDDNSNGGYYTDLSFDSPGPSPSFTEMFWVSTYLPPFNGEPLQLAQLAYLCRSSSVEIGSHPANAASWSCATLDESSSGSDAVFEEMPATLFSAQCGCNSTEAASIFSRGSPRSIDPTEDSSTTTTEEVDVSSSSSSSSSSSGCEDYSWQADGECNAGNNNADCDYDGGDCCECTCVDTEEYTCGDFDCIDPSALCSDEDASDGNDLVETGNTEASTQHDESSATKMTTNKSVLFAFATMLVSATVSIVLVV